MPSGETRIIGLEACHECKPASRPQHCAHPIEFACRIAEVLGNLAAGDCVVSASKHGSIGCKERIIDRHAMTGLAHHSGKGGSGSASKIENFGTGREPVQKWCRELGQKSSITRIVWIVAMQRVVVEFTAPIEAFVWVKPGRAAGGALQVGLAS